MHDNFQPDPPIPDISTMPSQHDASDMSMMPPAHDSSDTSMMPPVHPDMPAEGLQPLSLQSSPDAPVSFPGDVPVSPGKSGTDGHDLQSSPDAPVSFPGDVPGASGQASPNQCENDGKDYPHPIPLPPDEPTAVKPLNEEHFEADKQRMHDAEEREKTLKELLELPKELSQTPPEEFQKPEPPPDTTTPPGPTLVE